MSRTVILIINDHHRWIGLWNNLHQASLSLHGADHLSITIFEITPEGMMYEERILFKRYGLSSVDSNTLVYHAKDFANRTALSRLETYLAGCGYRKYLYNLVRSKTHQDVLIDRNT